MELKYINMSYLNPYLWLRVHPSCRGKIAPSFFVLTGKPPTFIQKFWQVFGEKNVHKQVHPLAEQGWNQSNKNVFSDIPKKSHFFRDFVDMITKFKCI